MHKFRDVDLLLAFVIVCIAMTLTAVVAFATPSTPYEMHLIDQALATKELNQ